MNAEGERFVLPTGYSLGRITVYRPGENEIPEFIEARGTITVPVGVKLFLDVSQEVCDDLSRIHLVPEPLLANGITFSEKNLENADFGELLSLKLRCLVISFCNQILERQIDDLGEMKTLQHLNLSHTPFAARKFSWISGLPDLKTLLLSGTGAGDRCLPFVTNLQHLETFHLAHSKITDRAVQTIWKMSSLNAVNLGECQVGDEALEGVGSCLPLRSLTVPDTRVSDAGVEIIVTEALRTGQRLASLSLRSCRITDKSLVRLSCLKWLRVLDLFSTEVTPSGAAFLKKSLPNCRIFIERDKGGGPAFWQGGEA